MSQQITITVDDKTAYSIHSCNNQPTTFTFYGAVEWTKELTTDKEST